MSPTATLSVTIQSNPYKMGSDSRAALDKQQNALIVEELTSLLERVSPEETEVITRIQSVLNIKSFIWPC